MCADYAVRVFAPLALEARGFEDRAKRMRSCAKIIDKETAKAGQVVAKDAYAAAYAAAKYKKVRAQIVEARLQLLDDMLKLTEQVEETPIVAEKLKELAEITK